MDTIKQNVAVFDTDVECNLGYRYTTHAKYSSVVANERITRATLAHIRDGVHSAVDAGCGDGTYTADIHAARPGLQLCGFDPAAQAIGVARRRHAGIAFEVGDILRPETFPRRRFDLAIIRGVLHHLPDPRAALRNCRLLADELLIIEPNGNNPILKVIEKTSAYHREHEEQSFAPGRLRHWCKEAGYEVESQAFIGFIPFFSPTPMAKLIHGVQAVLEKIPLLGRYFGAQVVLKCRAVSPTRGA